MILFPEYVNCIHINIRITEIISVACYKNWYAERRYTKGIFCSHLKNFKIIFEWIKTFGKLMTKTVKVYAHTM